MRDAIKKASLVCFVVQVVLEPDQFYSEHMAPEKAIEDVKANSKTFEMTNDRGVCEILQSQFLRVDANYVLF